MPQRKNSMRYRKTENTMALLGGALLGAAAMYLLDPQAGRRRRERLAETTGDALGRAGETIGPAWESISERARDLGGRLSESASAFGSAASERAADARDSGSSMLSGWGDAIGSFGRRFTRRARGYGDDAAGAARDYAARARGVLPWGGREESHAGAYTAAGLSAAALGAAAIYLFDPTSGRTRRKMVADQANRIMSDTGRCMRQSGHYVKDLLNRGRGIAHETRARFSSTPVGDVSPEMLVQRIRSQMGHVVSNAGAIGVMVNDAGGVTLTGSVLAGELDELLSTVERVPGVGQIVNRLDVQDSPEAVSGDAGTMAGRRL